ncbi:VOC family protein [Alkalihalobacillus hwajinpoensis]|uniref:VOC family protein n=1 Tax=Guptibacillus hwajinpoensis TaxID=208199 RepID=UPI00188460EE|nr:VOC family protein [Pseudalkalibacillus hwajinpoensis]MBF0708743.1 VOC family protein [Pseudalkalibacillus hwajinpoensis]
MIHHIELYVSDLKESTEFWGWLLKELGYTPFQNWKEGRSWRDKESYIVFVQVEEKYKEVGYHRKRIGINHLAFRAHSKEQVENIRLMLVQKQASILYNELYPHAGGINHYALYFEDPDRIKVEIVSPNI